MDAGEWDPDNTSAADEQQSELEEYVKKLQKELQEKLEKKQEMFKEAQDEYESAKASVETVESAKGSSWFWRAALRSVAGALKSGGRLVWNCSKPTNLLLGGIVTQ